jgi:hypothetical protein
MSLSTMRECRVTCGSSSEADRVVVHSGVMISPRDQVTAQKYDLQFGTNVIGKRPVRVRHSCA